MLGGFGIWLRSPIHLGTWLRGAKRLWSLVAQSQTLEHQRKGVLNTLDSGCAVLKDFGLWLRSPKNLNTSARSVPVPSAASAQCPRDSFPHKGLAKVPRLHFNTGSWHLAEQLNVPSGPKGHGSFQDGRRWTLRRWGAGMNSTTTTTIPIRCLPCTRPGSSSSCLRAR